MPKTKNVGKNPAVSPRIMHLRFPDEQTLAFWRATADDPGEYASRIAKFSRLSKNQPKKVVKPPRIRPAEIVKGEQSKNSRALGNLLVMPKRFDS